ncbi:putative apolipoprotein D [Operophtera brumata]|uniref:Putative apolipoprotein D n=1 Tax=Operophtera brumata TaxID=104452 RepID=A0A0L7KYW7_OPEBR|nr:putative apolipoprotein D [Operophtera brumata]
MPYIIGRLLPGAGLYNVLFTDYSHFAIVWSCTSLSLAHAAQQPHALHHRAAAYNVLFTDYSHFAIVWSCTSLSLAHADRIWVLGRERELEAPVRAQIYSIMTALGLDPDRLILSKNNNCKGPEIIN